MNRCADTAVEIVVTDRLGCDGVWFERQSVSDLDRCDLGDDASERFEVVGDVNGREVDIAGGTASVERGKEDAALEDEPFGVG